MKAEIAGSPLFLTAASLGEVEKVANVKLGRDPAKWESEIMMYLHEQNPFLQEHDIRIHMNRTDPEAGAGVGQIVIDDKAAIPLIIENFKLSPLDLFWHEGKLRPMTKATFLSSLQKTELGTASEPGQGELADMSIYNVTRAPFSGKYSFSSGLSFTLDDLKKSFETIGREGTEYALAANTILRGVVTDYAVAARETLQKEAEAKQTWKVEEIKFRPYEDVSQPGIYSVLFGGTDKCAAFVFDQVIGWDANPLEPTKPMGVKLAMSLEGDRTIAIAEHVGGREIKDANGLSKIAMAEAPKTNDVGFFWMIKEGHAVATWPVRFLYLGSNEDGVPFIKVADFMATGGFKTIYASDKYQGFHQLGDTVFMGPEWNWMGCAAGLGKVANSIDSNKIDWPLNAVEIRCRGLSYSIHGAEMDEVSKTGESRTDFCRALSERTGPSVALEMMKKAETSGSAFFTMGPASEPSGGGRLEKIAAASSSFESGPVNLIQAAARIRPCEGYSFFKIALDVSEQDAKSTVDTVLGLNFLNEVNLLKFMEHTDELEEASSSLAKLLLASRLGLQLEQGPVKTALFSLDNVIRQLKQLRSSVDGAQPE